MEVILLLGPPGSGKSTHAKLLAQCLPSCRWISMGTLLRDEIENKTELGKRIKDIVAKGELVPTDVCYEVLEPFAYNAQCEVLIIDGFPRCVEQIDIVVDLFPDPTVININCSFETIHQRLMKRSRYDDQENIISKRFAVYTDETMPALDQLRDQYKVFTVCGDDDISVVQSNILRLITNKE